MSYNPCVACGAVGVPGAARAVLWAGLLGVPVGGCPPARRQRRELRSARRLEARPGPATVHRHRSLAPPPSTSAAPAVLRVVRRLELGQAPPPPTGAVGNSHETVIASAGVCAVSSEIDE